MLVKNQIDNGGTLSFLGKKGNSAYIISNNSDKGIYKEFLTLRESQRVVSDLSKSMAESQPYYFDNETGKLFFKNEQEQNMFTVRLKLEVDEYTPRTDKSNVKPLNKIRISNSAIDSDFLKKFFKILKSYN